MYPDATVVQPSERGDARASSGSTAVVEFSVMATPDGGGELGSTVSGESASTVIATHGRGVAT